MSNKGKPPRGGVEARYRREETPLSSSGVVIRRAPGATSADPRRRRLFDSERALTPYQARLDVAMDDTAVSKVRDPSVSISLGADQLAPSSRVQPKAPRSSEAIASVLVGTVIGAVLVLVLVWSVRAVFG